MTLMINRPLTALGFAAAVAGVLLTSGCSAELAPIASVPSDAPVVTAPAAQPDPGASPLQAADQLIHQNLSFLAAGDFAGACSLYMPAFQQSLMDVAAPGSTDCASALDDGYKKSVDTAVIQALQNGEDPVTPFFYIPSSVAVDSTKMQVDSDTSVHVPNDTVTSTDPTAFADGASVTPGWLSRSFYVEQDADGIWRFAAASERQR